jgi:hypothetical protein
MTLEEIKQALLDKCKENGGSVSDLEIMFIFPKASLPSIDSINEKDFLAKFNVIKTLIKGRKSNSVKITDKASRNLIKLVKSGYTWNDLRYAIEGMYFPEPNGLKSWAERTGNDTPTHLLIETNFERYLNIYHNGKSNDKATRTVDDKRKDAINRLIGG